MIENEINFEEDDPMEAPPENDELAEVASHGPQKHRYYESPKVLGRLYREIDEHIILNHVKRQAKLLETDIEQPHNLASAVWSYVRERTAVIQWHHYRDFAQNVRDMSVANFTVPTDIS